MQEVGITHVVNVAEGPKATNVRGEVGELEAAGIAYMGCPCEDADNADISKFFKVWYGMV